MKMWIYVICGHWSVHLLKSWEINLCSCNLLLKAKHRWLTISFKISITSLLWLKISISWLRNKLALNSQKTRFVDFGIGRLTRNKKLFARSGVIIFITTRLLILHSSIKSYLVVVCTFVLKLIILNFCADLKCIQFKYMKK